MIVNHWSRQFMAQCGGSWPDSYVAIDLEYTGNDYSRDVICEVGHVLVENRHITDQLKVVLDWTHSTIVPKDWLARRLREIALKMANGGHTWRTTWEVMAAEGIDAIEGLRFYYDLIRKAQKRGLPFVGHNAYSSEERTLQANFEGFLNKAFSFGDNSLFDTGAVEKASLAMAMAAEGKLDSKTAWWLPKAGETLRGYFCRVVNVRASGVYWNLADALKRYGLVEKHSLDLEKCHSADYDAYVTHLLFEHYRSMITVNHAAETGAESPAALQRAFEQSMAAKDVQQVKAQAQAQRRAGSLTAPKNFVRRYRGQRAV
jgi:DNA polymerase III epsilon subunit-like protein